MAQIDLVMAARRGDKQAFAQVVEPLEDRLYQIALAITSKREDAEDAWQNSLLRAWRGIRGLRHPETFTAWLSRIVLNEARRLVTGRSAFAVLSPEGEGRGADVEERPPSGSDQERKWVILACLRQIPVPQREAILLRYWLDLPLDEIARAAGVPLGTVKTRLYRGVDNLKRLLAKEGISRGDL